MKFLGKTYNFFTVFYPQYIIFILKYEKRGKCEIKRGKCGKWKKHGNFPLFSHFYILGNIFG